MRTTPRQPNSYQNQTQKGELTMITGIRKTGEFCWINIVTPKPAEAMEFFAKVLGWTFFEMPGMGHGMQVDGHNIGGIFDIEGPNAPPGMSPVLGVMVKVDNAD